LSESTADAGVSADELLKAIELIHANPIHRKALNEFLKQLYE
jgi:hypothetical protein